MVGTDSNLIPAAALPASNVGLGWYNNNRKRLKKFAGQYVGEASAAVVTLRSQGEADISNPDVIASRAGFNELPVSKQSFHLLFKRRKNLFVKK